MSLFAALADPESESRSFTRIVAGSHPSSLIEWLTGGVRTFSGADVSENNAMQFTAFYAAVRVISESIAQLPVGLYRRNRDGTKEEAFDVPQHGLMRMYPNPEMSAFTFKETSQGHLCTWGNSYAQIQMNGRGEAVSLWPLRPDKMDVRRNERTTALEYKYATRDQPFTPDEILHIPALSSSGVIGFSPVRMARESIGLGMALEKSGAAMFGNGNFVGGIVKHPGRLNDEGKERVRHTIERVHKGFQNAFRLGVLDEGMEWQSIGLPNEDMQFLETRRFQVEEVARWFRIPPHMLAELTHATFSNIEHQGISFVVHTLMPWVKRWEAELNRKVLTQAQRNQGLHFSFDVNAFLRGDFKTRTEGYASAIQNGWMTINQVRGLEGMNPAPGGDVYLVQGNLVPISQAGSQMANPLPARSEARQLEKAVEVKDSTKRSIDARYRLQRSFLAEIEKSASRLNRSTTGKIRSQLAKLTNLDEFRAWLEDFFTKQGPFAQEVMGPILRAFMASVGAEAITETGADFEAFRAELENFQGDYLNAFQTRYAEGSKGQLEALMRNADSQDQAIADMGQRLDEWDQKTPAKMARFESFQAMNAVSFAAYAFATVYRVRWHWNGGECTICPHMDGKVVEIGRAFVDKGDTVGDPQKGTPLEVKSLRRHPPLHRGCECILSAAD